MHKISVLLMHGCLTALFNYYALLGGQTDQRFVKLRYPTEHLTVRSTKHSTMCATEHPAKQVSDGAPAGVLSGVPDGVPDGAPDGAPDQVHTRQRTL